MYIVYKHKYVNTQPAKGRVAAASLLSSVLDSFLYPFVESWNSLIFIINVFLFLF